jgi:hypothetical protein
MIIIYQKKNIMNWLIEDMSSNKKRIFVNRKEMQRKFRESNEKSLKLVEMRNFIRENKDNVEEGHTIYKNDIEDYKKILLEECVSEETV